MTREEAIYRLKNTAWLGSDDDREEAEEAVVMAIKALEDIERWRTWSHTYDNLISRQDAIDAMARDIPFITFTEDPKRTAQRIIGTVPSADRPTRWIPVSERLPGKDGRYLVTYPLIGDDLWVATAWYGTPPMPNRPVKGKCFFVSDDEWGDVPYDDVMAWMPLPEPYKEGGKEDD